MVMVARGFKKERQNGKNGLLCETCDEGSYGKEDTAPLSEKDRQEAQSLVAWFEGKCIDAIYSSPYARTIGTVEPLAHAFQMSVQVEEGLREGVIGQWVDGFDTYAADQWRDFDYRLSRGESLKQVQQRIVPCFQEILSQTRRLLSVVTYFTRCALSCVDEWRPLLMNSSRR